MSCQNEKCFQEAAKSLTAAVSFVLSKKSKASVFNLFVAELSKPTLYTVE